MKLFIVCIIILLSLSVQAQVTIEEFPYAGTESELKGFFAYDKLLKSKRGGVLIVTEGESPEAYIKERAEELAELGYVVFVPTLFAKAEKAKPGKASDVNDENQPDNFQHEINLSLEILANHVRIDPARLAALGYGQGGSAVLEMARSGANVKAAINYFGDLTAQVVDANRKITPSILVLIGSEDPERSEEEIKAFREEMKTAGADWQMNIYGGAVSSFTYYEAGFEAASGHAYNYDADKRSWEAAKSLLREKLK